jgi:RHS repeat-associated protein
VCLNSQGNLATDKLFTGQRLDATGLYYYGARYYDPTIGRFISPDTVVQNPGNPQTLNRYSYVVNNPLKYTDPTGLDVYIGDTNVSDYEQLLQTIIDAGEWIDPNSPLMTEFYAQLAGLGSNGLDLLNEWEKFSNQEQRFAQQQPGLPNFAQLMEDSFIKFDVTGVDVAGRTVSFFPSNVLEFNEPVNLHFVTSGRKFNFLNEYNSPAYTDYPQIYMRGDRPFLLDEFTWDVAHESYHFREQELWGLWTWKVQYAFESRFGKVEHDLRPSEIRASAFADAFMQTKPYGLR